MKHLSQLLQDMRIYWKINNVPNISDVHLFLLKDLINISKPNNILEIWTANGFSTIWMWEELVKYWWHITTIDFSPQSYKIAQTNFKTSWLEKSITSLFWNALDIVPTLSENYDFVFIDGMMRRSVDFLWLTWNKINTWWIIIIDDVIKFKHKMIWLDDFLEKHDISYNILPIDSDDGIMMIIKPDISIPYDKLSH